MKVEFIASFDENRQVLALRGDMSGTLKLDYDGSQLPQIVKLTLFRGKRMRITVEEDK